MRRVIAARVASTNTAVSRRTTPRRLPRWRKPLQQTLSSRPSRPRPLPRDHESTRRSSPGRRRPLAASSRGRGRRARSAAERGPRFAEAPSFHGEPQCHAERAGVARLADEEPGVAGRGRQQIEIVLVEQVARPHRQRPAVRRAEADAHVDAANSRRRSDTSTRWSSTRTTSDSWCRTRRRTRPTGRGSLPRFGVLAAERHRPPGDAGQVRARHVLHLRAAGFLERRRRVGERDVLAVGEGGSRRRTTDRRSHRGAAVDLETAHAHLLGIGEVAAQHADARVHHLRLEVVDVGVEQR